MQTRQGTRAQPDARQDREGGGAGEEAPQPSRPGGEPRRYAAAPSGAGTPASARASVRVCSGRGGSPLRQARGSSAGDCSGRAPRRPFGLDGAGGCAASCSIGRMRREDAVGGAERDELLGQHVPAPFRSAGAFGAACCRLGSIDSGLGETSPRLVGVCGLCHAPSPPPRQEPTAAGRSRLCPGRSAGARMFDRKIRPRTPVRCQAKDERLFHERVFASRTRSAYPWRQGRQHGHDGRSTNVRVDTGGKAAQDSRVHRGADPRPGLSSVGSRDRRSRRSHVAVDGAHASSGAPAGGLPAAGPDQAEGDHRQVGAVLGRRHTCPPRGPRALDRTRRGRHRRAR